MTAAIYSTVDASQTWPLQKSSICGPLIDDFIELTLKTTSIHRSLYVFSSNIAAL